MPLTPQVEERLCRHLIERVIGGASGRASNRVYRNRPRDFFYIGSLWPSAWDETDEEEEYVLKKGFESRLECPSIGFDCMLDGCAPPDTVLECSVQFRCFYRVLPSWEELGLYTSWEQPARVMGPDGSYQDAGPREADLPVVFHALDVAFGPIAVRLDDLSADGSVVQIDLSPQLRAFWDATGAQARDAYPGRSNLRVMESQVSDPEQYASWCQGLTGQPAYPDWRPYLEFTVGRLLTDPTCLLLTTCLVNRSADQRTGDSRRITDVVLFDARVQLTAPSALFRVMEFAPLPRGYRYDRTMPCHGVNCHAWATEAQGRRTLYTEAAPVVEREKMVPRTEGAPAPEFARLRDDPAPVLLAVADSMKLYAEKTWAPQRDHHRPEDLDEFDRDLEGFREEIRRFETGVQLLADSGPTSPIRQAFSLMNETFRRHGLASQPQFTAWRLFQVVFIVSQIASLLGREDPARFPSENETVDVLWAPTGGGKTEAYLGVVLLHLFFDRLRGKRVGVTALLRFPLRLLALDQFQRVARLLATAELVRQEQGLAGDPFAIANWVGEGGSPNKLEPRDIDTLTNNPEEAQERWCKLRACPFCGSQEIAVGYDEIRHVLGHRCIEPGCPWTEEWLPIYVVDYDIYRYLPSVIVATVDKFAAQGYNRRFANLFGAVNEHCPVHGYGFCGDNEGCKKHGCRAAKPINGSALYDPAPALQVQDELHLIKEELGVFDSHYETFCLHVQETLGTGTLPHWKVVAATATIEDYEKHIRELYVLDARRFPGPGPTWDESFYAHPVRGQVGRFYVGVLGFGKAHTNIVTDLLRLYHAEMNRLWQLWRTDQTALAEILGDAGELAASELQELLLLHEISLTYVLTKKGGDQVAEVLENRVNRALLEADRDGDEVLSHMLTGAVAMSEVAATKHEIEQPDPDLPPGRRLRSVIATNMISHGVDISRLNAMVFGGMPHAMAEYIQASSRVGRSHPGIVMCAVTPHRERDRSYYLLFRKFHEYLDLLVEPAAINRWSAHAIRRTLPGLVLGYALNVLSRQVGRRTDELLVLRDVLGPAGTLTVAEVCEWIADAYQLGTNEHDRLRQITENQTEQLFAQLRSTTGMTSGWIYDLFPYMRSLRDVEEDVEFRGAPAEMQALTATMRPGRRGQ